MYGLKNIPASRFSKHNSNGLWEYSPFLCASGLVEGIILVQRVVMDMWDRIPEPTLAIHLHNMLVKKGYLKEKVGIYAKLEELLQEWFFSNGVPNDNFSEALVARLGQRSNNRALQRQREAVSRDNTKNIHNLLDAKFNLFFREKSSLMLYYDATWVPDKIPDSIVKIPSALYVTRLADAERFPDPATGETRLKETELVKRAKAKGQSDASILESASLPLTETTAEKENIQAAMDRIDEFKDYTTSPDRNPYRVSEKSQGRLQGCALLEILRFDLFADVCGRTPISSLNYIWITCHIMILFMKFEERFREARHPLWIEAYENPRPQLRRQKRLALVGAVMANEDEEAMKLFAQAFEEIRLDVLAYIFWEDLREGEDGLKSEGDDDEPPTDQCLVM
jgi:hypothetical protein